MEQGKKKTYTVKNPTRLVAVLAAAVVVLLLLLGWALFLNRVRRHTADLAAYTTLTRTGETVTAVLDVDSLLTELELPNPRTEPEAAARSKAVKAILAMELELAFTPEPDMLTVTANVNERALKRQGIVLKEKTWTALAKVLPRTAQEEPTFTAQEVDRPTTRLPNGYLTALLDEEGKGLNLQPVCEKVRFERDRLAKEIFGNNYVTIKTNVWFIVYPEGSQRHNVYRAVFTLAETGAREGRSVKDCCFTVDVPDLSYHEGAGIGFSNTDVAIYPTYGEASSLEEFTAQGCAITELVGGSVQGPERPSFDYNGFVRFVGRPMSHPLPDGTLWSPSLDPLEEDDLWRLVGNGEYTMTELLDYVCMEIYARRGYTFPNEDQAAYRQHFSACDWYSGTEDAPERFMTATERENLNLVRRLKDLLES